MGGNNPCQYRPDEWAQNKAGCPQGLLQTNPWQSRRAPGSRYQSSWLSSQAEVNKDTYKTKCATKATMCQIISSHMRDSTALSTHTHSNTQEIGTHCILFYVLFISINLASSSWILINQPIFFRVTPPALGWSYDCPSAREISFALLTLGQSYDCPSACEISLGEFRVVPLTLGHDCPSVSEVTLRNTGNLSQTTNSVHSSWDTLRGQP